MPSRALAFDPTPAGLVSDRSLRKAYKNEWARIRTAHFKSGNFTCEICRIVESEARLIHAHEIYSFPDPQIVRLEKIAFICTLCHDAIHLERTRFRCGPEYIAKVEAHYCEVNELSMDDLKLDYAETVRHSAALRAFYRGPEARPRLDYGPYQAAADRCEQRKRKKPAPA